jgi:transcriptional regulator
MELLPGTLDMLILRTLAPRRAHGHEIARHLQQTTGGLLRVEHGSLYPALHRLARQGWVSAEWDTPPEGNRKFKYYRLTAKGKRHLAAEQARWNEMAAAIARVLTG